MKIQLFLLKWKICFVLSVFLLAPICLQGLEMKKIDPQIIEQLSLREADAVTGKILAYWKSDIQKKKEDKQGHRPLVFLAFFDMDGTIIDGDITEGRSPRHEGEERVPGLAELTILKELGKDYNEEEDLPLYLEEYEELQKSDEMESIRYCSYNVTGLESETRDKLNQLVYETFKNSLQKYYFSSSISFLRFLQENGVEVYVVSASPEIFVKGASQTLGVPYDHLFGVNLEKNHNGDLIDPIVNYREGKIQRVVSIVKEWESKGYDVILFAGLGNSWSSDAPFLSYIAERGGWSFMINKESMIPEYQESRIILLKQRQI